MYSHAKHVSSPLRHYFFADFLLKEICKTFSSHLLVTRYVRWRCGRANFRSCSSGPWRPRTNVPDREFPRWHAAAFRGPHQTVLSATRATALCPLNLYCTTFHHAAQSEADFRTSSLKCSALAAKWCSGLSRIEEMKHGSDLVPRPDHLLQPDHLIKKHMLSS
jgi:hypothetical protein